LDKKTIRRNFSNESKRKDGMDIGISSNKSKKVLNYAAAKLDLCFIRIKIHQVKANCHPIGNMGTKRVQEKNFQTHSIEYQQIFLSICDDFPDQFEEKKIVS
jgi:hypothetical protein